MSQIEQNTTGLEEILDTIYNLPEADSGREPIVESLSVTENGTYTPSEGVDGFDIVTVNVPQEGGSGGSGIIDVTELPTSNIDENAVYRVTESIQTEKTEIYINAMGTVTVQQYLASLGVPTVPNIYVVDELSNMLETDVQTFSAIHLYILKSDGIVYINTPAYGGIITMGLFGFQYTGYDRGFTENINAETENGVYTTIEAYKQIEKWFVRENCEWKEITAHIETPTPHRFTDIERLSGEYTSGDMIEVTRNKTVVDITKSMFEDRVIPSSIAVNIDVPDVSVYITRNIAYIPKSHFLDSYGEPINIIGEFAFAGFAYMHDIQLPDGLIEIGSYAFYNCQNLALTSLPDGLIRIDSYAFYNCQNLALTSLPDGLIEIGSYAFYNCQNLALTSLPEHITRINENAFYNCQNLALTSLPEHITRIDNEAFWKCQNLALTSLPEHITFIGGSAFLGCTNLALTSLPDGLIEINPSAFLGCTNLALTSLPESVRYVSYNAFGNCTNLVSMTLKSKCISDYTTIFDGCDNLTILNVPWSEGEVKGAPWGATNATINYNYTEG